MVNSQFSILNSQFMKHIVQKGSDPNCSIFEEYEKNWSTCISIGWRSERSC